MFVMCFVILDDLHLGVVCLLIVFYWFILVWVLLVFGGVCWLWFDFVSCCLVGCVATGFCCLGVDSLRWVLMYWYVVISSFVGCMVL